MQKQLIIFLLILFSTPSISQESSWFYIRAKDTLFTPEFKSINNTLIYNGDDIKLKSIMDKYTLFEFKKTFKKPKKEDLKKTFFVVTDNKELLFELLKRASHIFDFGELIEEEDKKIFEPNDYGVTSTIGENLGLQVDLSYLDFLGLPEAWYYTTGESKTIIGISDASTDITDLDFKDKTKVVKMTRNVKGHGSSVASIAAAQGDNKHGAPGVCYDCGIYTTKYGDFKNLAQLLELSRLGVKVINCSWSGTMRSETAQAVIDEMFENGTIVVSSSGNRNWIKTKGEKKYYPASYNHVISVSAGMYKYESLTDNILISEKGNPYGENIRGYVGRTIGFKDHNVKNGHHIYPVSITTLNNEVDILSPSTGVFSYGKYLLNNKISYDLNEHTSNATPLVTGTIGLMFSLYPCLPVTEVESIIKLSSMNIDHIKANQPYKGNYGAGLLQTGNAVKLVYNLYSETEIATIENQNFSRWDFKLTSYSKKVVIQNQKFTDSSTLNLTAKNSIVIGENSILKPNSKGQIILKIDPTLEKECDLVLREGFPNNKYYHPSK